MTMIDRVHDDKVKGMTAEYVTQVIVSALADKEDILGYFGENCTEDEADEILALIPDAAIFFQWPEAE